MDPYMYHSPVNFPITNTPVNLGFPAIDERTYDQEGLGMFYDRFEGGPVGASFGFGYGGVGNNGYSDHRLGGPFDSSGTIMGVPNVVAYPGMGAVIGAAASMVMPNMSMPMLALIGAAAGFGLNWMVFERARREGAKPGSIASQVAAVATQQAQSAMSAITGF